MKHLIMTLILLFSPLAYSLELFEIGPSVRLLEVPHPAQIGVETRFLAGTIGVSIHKGMLPSQTIDGASVKLNNFEIGVKYYPLTGGFFVGLLKGKQEVDVSKSDTVMGTPVNYYVNVKNDYLTPHLGYEWRFPGGLFLSMQLGWQLSSNASTNVSTSEDSNPLVTSNPDYQEQKQDAINIGNDLGNTDLPNVGLLQIGWLF